MLRRLQVKIGFVLVMSAFSVWILMSPLQAHASIPFKNIKKNNDSSEDIWKQIAKDFTLSEYEDTPEVQKQIRWYQQHSKSLTQITERAAPYLYYIHQQVKEKGLPGELVLLPIIESAYNPFAYSQGASGLWQLMPQTGSRLGIKQNASFDGRRDVVSSTQAALNYLGYLDTVFNDNWLLAIAAYNSGPGTVLNADKANKGDHGDTEFWSLHLPATTKQYVPRLLAIAAIISNPEKYGVHLPDVPNEPYFAKVDVDSPIALSKVAKLSNMPVNDIYNLNAGYKQKQVASNTPTHLLIPVEKIQTFKQNMDAQGKTVSVQMPALAATGENISSASNHNTKDTYQVKAGDTLSAIAKKEGIAMSSLRLENRLKNDYLKIGQILTIPSVG